MTASLAEQESRDIAGVDDTTWEYLSGTTDIDDSVQTETTPFSILEIAPQTGSPVMECEVWLDLAKATTGFGAVESTATITFQVARKVDGTNWRREAINEAALTGTLAATRMQKIRVGHISVTHGCRIYATTSADVTSDIEIPYVVAYRAAQAPTVTPVAAG